MSETNKSCFKGLSFCTVVQVKMDFKAVLSVATGHVLQDIVMTTWWRTRRDFFPEVWTQFIDEQKVAPNNI